MAVKRWRDLKDKGTFGDDQANLIEAKIFQKYPKAIRRNKSSSGLITFYVPNIGDLENTDVFIFPSEKEYVLEHTGYTQVVCAQLFAIEMIDGIIVRLEGMKIPLFITYAPYVFPYEGFLINENAIRFVSKLDVVVYNKITKSQINIEDIDMSRLTEGVKGLMLFT